MPRNTVGEYTLPAGNPVVSGTTITSTWANPTMSDIAAALTDSLSRSGQGGMTAPFKVADGSMVTPGVSFSNEPTSGIYRESAGVIGWSIAAQWRMKLSAFGINTRTGLAVSSAAGVGTLVLSAANAPRADIMSDGDFSFRTVDGVTQRAVIGAGGSQFPGDWAVLKDANPTIYGRSADGTKTYGYVSINDTNGIYLVNTNDAGATLGGYLQLDTANNRLTYTGPLIAASGATALLTGVQFNDLSYQYPITDKWGTAYPRGVIVSDPTTGNFGIGTLNSDASAWASYAHCMPDRVTLYPYAYCQRFAVRSDLNGGTMDLGGTGTRLFHGGATLDLTGTALVANVSFTSTGILQSQIASPTLRLHSPSVRILDLQLQSDGNVCGLYDVSGGQWRWYTNWSYDFVATGNVFAYSDPRVKRNFTPFYLTEEQLATIGSWEFDRTDIDKHQQGGNALEIQAAMPHAVGVSEEGGLMSVDYGKAAFAMVCSLAKIVREQCVRHSYDEPALDETGFNGSL